MKKRSLQHILSFALLALTLGVVLYIGLNGNDLSQLSDALQNLSPLYLLICLICWAVYVLMDALVIYHFLHIQHLPITLWQCIHAAIVGIYYCNVTPGASGGQPMEMYCLSRYKIPVGISGSAMAVKFVVFQVVLLIAGAVLWGTHGAFVRSYAAGSVWFILLGYAANFVTIGMVILMAVSQNAVRWVIDRCIRIGIRLKICKDPESSREKWENHCKSFLSSFQMVLQKPIDLFVQCVIALIQLMSLMVVIIAVYRALGLSGITYVELITMGVLLYIGASYVPLPGASGAQEGGFAMMFRQIFPDANCFVALLIWRFCTYYLSVLVGAVVTTVDNLRLLRQKNDAEVEESKN